MGKLFELLAAEKALSDAAKKLIEETKVKFQKADSFFKGHSKSLTMLNESIENQAIQDAARDTKLVTASVHDTVDYVLDHWAKAEDCIFQKNATNRNAVADLEFRGSVLAAEVPVDELMGLENRLKDLRGMMQEMPTRDNSKEWEADTDTGKGFWKSKGTEVTTKTTKVMTPIIMYAATDKHPAQIEKVTNDVVVGKFETRFFSGCATTIQKSEAIKAVDELIVECRKARNRANTVQAADVTIGGKIKTVLMAQLERQE